jgi:hypothetical protein
VSVIVAALLAATTRATSRLPGGGVNAAVVAEFALAVASAGVEPSSVIVPFGKTSNRPTPTLRKVFDAPIVTDPGVPVAEVAFTAPSWKLFCAACAIIVLLAVASSVDADPPTAP